MLTAALTPSSQRAPLTAPGTFGVATGSLLCAKGLPEGSEQPCPGPTLPGLKTHQFPLPFPLNQPAESFINLRKRESKQKELKAEPKRDLSNLPSLSSLGPRYYLSASAESPPSGDAPGPSGGAGPRHSPRSSNDSVISALSSPASLRRAGSPQPTPAGTPRGMDSSHQSVGFRPCPIWGSRRGLSPPLAAAAAGTRV